MKKFTLFLIASVYVAGFTQNTPDWDHSYQESGDNAAWSMVQASDEGYTMVGYSDSQGAGGTDILLVKTDADGDSLWSKTYGGIEDESAYYINLTSDDGYVIVGSTKSYASGTNVRDIWLIKTNADGEEIWSKTCGEGTGRCVQQTLDSGYIIAGSKLVKTNSEGEVEWSLGTSCKSVMQTDDGGYIVLGQFPSMSLVKRDSNGGEVWTQTYGGGGSDFPGSVKQTTDGGYIIVGSTSSYGAGLLDAWLIKTDASGVEEWSETYGGDKYDEGHDVQETHDGGFILVGSTQKHELWDDDFLVIKTDKHGVQQWYWVEAEDPESCGRGYAVQQTSDNGYAAAGFYAINNPNPQPDEYDMRLVHFPPEPLTVRFNPNSIENSLNVKLYPNPVNGDIINLDFSNNAQSTSIQVFNKHWAEIDKYETEAGEMILNISKYPAGIYFIKVKSGSETSIKKFIKI